MRKRLTFVKATDAAHGAPYDLSISMFFESDGGARLNDIKTIQANIVVLQKKLEILQHPALLKTYFAQTASQSRCDADCAVHGKTALLTQTMSAS